MSTRPRKVPLADDVPWSTTLSEYDEAHFVVYLRLLDAKAKGASEAEMLQVIYDADPAKPAANARQSLKSHLERARWMTEEGYKGLFAERDLPQ